MRVRVLNDHGRQIFVDWLKTRKSGEQPPSDLLNNSLYSHEAEFPVEIDLDQKFATRFDFGKYVAEKLSNFDANKVLSVKQDGMWDWLVVAYFSQFGRKVSKYWHYSVTRRGHAGSLAYRHLARTAFEMYWRHAENSMVMLHVDMATGGEMAEQLTSRQNVAYHRGFISAAHALYWGDGKLRRGAAGRVKALKKRKPGDTAGRGGAGRLALAVRRLCRTHDTHVVQRAEMLSLLPREFKAFVDRATSKSMA